MDEVRAHALELGQQARILLAAGKTEEAKNLLEQAVATDPSCPEVYDHYGAWYMVKGDYTNARGQFKKALLLDKSRGETHFNLGNAYLMLGELENCVESYNRALTNGFDTAGMQYYMALAYEEMGNLDLVLRHLNRAIAKDPADPNFKVKKAYTLIKMHRRDDALAVAEDIITSCPELYDGYHIRTNLLQSKEEYEKALASAQEAMTLFPNDVGLCMDEIRCLALCGRLEEADKRLDEAAQMAYFEEERPKFFLLKAEIKAENGDFDGAVEAARAACEAEDSYSGEAAQLLMELLGAADRNEELLELADKIYDREDEGICYRTAIYLRAVAREKLGQQEEAEKCYREAVTLYRTMTLVDPTLGDAYLYRAMAHRALGEYDKALEMTNFLITLDPTQVDPYEIQAMVYDAMGDQSKAEEARKQIEALEKADREG